jgi:lipoprotein NlpI
MAFENATELRPGDEQAWIYIGLGLKQPEKVQRIALAYDNVTELDPRTRISGTRRAWY